MSGTGGDYANGENTGGVSIPTPRVLIHPGGTQSGAHDLVSVGWMNTPDWVALQNHLPEIWLFRYKKGYSPARFPHTGFNFDSDRGWRHPSNGDSGRKYSGGIHQSRQGATLPVRLSEWLVTRDAFYDATFDPSLWFLDGQGKPQTWPIAPLATASFGDVGNVGQSGQGGNNTGTYVNVDDFGFRSSGHIAGTQRQFFAFAFAIRDDKDDRNRVVGPLSEPIRCDIWPRIRSSYGPCATLADRGRKVRTKQV